MCVCVRERERVCVDRFKERDGGVPFITNTFLFFPINTWEPPRYTHTRNTHERLDRLTHTHTHERSKTRRTRARVSSIRPLDRSRTRRTHASDSSDRLIEDKEDTLETRLCIHLTDRSMTKMTHERPTQPLPLSSPVAPFWVRLMNDQTKGETNTQRYPLLLDHGDTA